MSLKEKLREILSFVVRKREDMLLCKDLTVVSGLKSSGRLEVVPMHVGHLKELVEFIQEHHRETARSLRMLDDCFRNRYEGRVALLNGSIIGYRWWVTSAIPHPQLKLYGVSLLDDEVYAFGLYIARAFRAQGYAGEFLALTQKQLVDMGFKRLYNAVATSNVPSRRLYQTFGSKELGLRVSRSFFSTITFCDGRWLRYNPVWM
ncbi:MAG: GNAT family N-acetyltransferase [Sulfuricaulis sp.]|uniref:GNAT family N-acetyltransferase n=1 Tax=Sulfuricaulis sp. TaxID=2003553 RepID=UPI0025FCD145|nr:GNAT family N-acetyltransferase [Sulfuricaulis sp.]MCR4347876.1 GNAT family N-acetyltransferase [Sulfuricaulis sp.]